MDSAAWNMDFCHTIIPKLLYAYTENTSNVRRSLLQNGYKWHYCTIEVGAVGLPAK